MANQGIYPEYKTNGYPLLLVLILETCSTKDNINVEVRRKCHPIDTGKQKMVDTGGRVERFNKRFGLKK